MNKKLFLFDGNALAYRSYYAMGNLSNSSGQPTGAVLGFANYLVRIIKEHSPDYLAVAFDSGREGKRREIYPEYKANRAEMPEDLLSQLPLIYEFVDYMNISAFKKDGIEADDIISEIVSCDDIKGVDTYIVSGDKDLMQLVSDNVKLLAPSKQGGLSEMGPEEVKEKMGVPPERIIDLLSLMGDSSDNIPGVPGIGIKTAVKIVSEYGSIDNLLKDLDSIQKKSWKKKITENLKMLMMSRELVRLRHESNCSFKLDDMVYREPELNRAVEFLKEMEFNSLLREPVFDTRVASVFNHRRVGSIQELEEVVHKIREKGLVSVDTETTSLDTRGAELVGISFAVDKEEAFYIPVGHTDNDKNLDSESVCSLLKGVLESEDIKKVGQNLKYDIQIFRNCGIHVRGLWFDTMIAAYLLEPGSRRYNLSLLAEKWLGIKMIPLENLIGKGKKELPFSETDVDEACEYACEDAVIPLQLMEKMEPALENCGVKELFRDIEMPLIEVLADMEWNGICVDREFLKELDREYTGVSKEHERKVFEYAGRKFNLNSPKEVGSVLYDELQLPRGRKTKTGRSTDVRELNRLASDYAVARELLEYREVQKLLSTYIRALPQQINKVTKRVHTSFNQTVTASGRLSSTDPNLQNIPIRTEAGHRIRKSFVPDQGMILVAADYSQIELRILAHLSGDDRLKDAFVEDLDIHTQTASAMYQIFPEMVTPEKRRAAKTINFGLIYGMGPVKLSRELKVSYKEAESFIETYFEQFPSVKGYIESVKRDTEEKGYSETEFGRRRYFPDISSSARRVKEAAERSAVNHCVQGTAADIIKLAMIRIAEGIDEKYKDVKLLLQVHDELVFEVPEERVDEFGSWAEDKMSSVYELSVPLRVDTGYGADWSEAH